MRTVIIPARGKSERIKGKNIKLFAGQPMISWPLVATIETGLFDEVFVSTDSHEIAEVAEQFGARVLWRPHNLADSFTGTTPVIQNILLNQLADLRGDSWLYMVYPTSPITSSIVQEFVSFAEQDPSKFSVSVGEFANQIERAMELSINGELAFLSPDHINSRSQDLKKYFYDAGKLYASPVSAWRTTISPLLEGPRAFRLPTWASVDIDTKDDWLIAELCFTHLRDA